VELLGRAAELVRGSRGLAGLCERPTCQHPGQRGLDRHAELVGRTCRGEGALGGSAGVARREGDGSRGAIPESSGEAQPECLGAGFGLGRGAARLVQTAERQPASRQELQEMRPPGPRDEREVLPSGRTDEGLHGARGIAVLEEHRGQRVAGRSRDQTRLQP